MAKQQAPKAETPAKEQSQKAVKAHIVLIPFRDIDNFDKEHKVGTDVSHFDAERLASLVERGYVSAPKAAKAPVDAKPAEPEQTESEEEPESDPEGNNPE